MNKDDQILKSRDDKAPIFISKAEGDAGNENPFKLAEGSECSWLKKDEVFGAEKLRPRIEPWLTALFQSEHLALLVGSGLSHAVHRLATGASLPGMSPGKFTNFDKDINGEAVKSAAAAGRKEGKATGRKTLVMAGVWTSVCVAFPALQAKADGYKVYAVMDASGDMSEMASNVTLARMVHAGIIPATTNVVLCEFQRTWNTPMAAQWGALYNELVPHYNAVSESYQRAADFAKGAVK